jgi:hypothetical protein
VPLAIHIPAIPERTDVGTLNFVYFTIFQFVKKYGNIFSLEFAYIHSVLITGLPLRKEVFTNTEQNFLDRPISHMRQHTFNKNGKFLPLKSVLEILMV